MKSEKIKHIEKVDRAYDWIVVGAILSLLIVSIFFMVYGLAHFKE